MEVVEYSWPSHLRYQHEKQRLIWGYKILFLDVLFPLHVDKVWASCIYACICMCMHTCMCMHMHTYAYVHVHACSHSTSTRIIHVCRCIYIHMHAYAHTCIRAHVYACMQVIYVDSDQIVQGDLAELWDLPMTSGAPIAMTPFCREDPNAATSGFRFWSVS